MLDKIMFSRGVINCIRESSEDVNEQSESWQEGEREMVTARTSGEGE